MNRTEINLKSIVIGEGESFDESFSLVLDKGKGSYNFLFRVEKSEDKVFLNELVNALNDSFKEKFLEDGNLFNRFEAGVMKVNQVFLELTSEVEDLSLSAVLIAESNGKIAFTKSGSGEIYLVRSGEFMNVGDAIEVTSGSDELFDNVVSGAIEVKDRYIVSNVRLLRYVSESQLIRESLRMQFGDFVKWLTDKVEFELDGKLLIDFIECKDVVFRKEAPVVEKGEMLQRFKRGASFVFRSLARGDIKSIDAGLRKNIMVSVILLLIVFAGSTLYLAHLSVVRAEIDRYRDELDVAQLIINNAKSEFDKDAISNLLQNAEAKITLARGVEELEDESELLYDQIREIKSKVDNVVTVDPRLEHDIIGPAEMNYTLQSVHSDGVNLYAVTQNRLFQFVSGVEKEPITFDPGVGVDQYVWDDAEDTLYALNEEGAISVGDGLARNLASEDDDFNVQDGVSWYAGRLYALDVENRQIWRYQVGRDTVRQANPYLLEGYGRFIDSAVDLAIDGYIYVVTEGGDIFRFLSGELDDDFRIESKPMLPILNPTKIYTELDVPYVFVFEKSENRIVQYFKSSSRSSLDYVRQYYFPELDVVDFDIDYLGEKIYLIDDRSIYSIDLDTSS